MKYLLLFVMFFLLSSCNEQTDKRVVNTTKSGTTDTTIAIVWRVMEFDTTVGDTISTIIINNQYLKTAPDVVRAAIGFVGTFIGSDCQWDGDANDGMTNLSCKLITALGLGYQCSEKHLGFLRLWLQNEPELLKRLRDCPVTPFTASSQNTFDKLELIINNDIITLRFEGSGVNMRMEKNWTWTGEYIFRARKKDLQLISKKESEPEYSDFFGD